jgi:hypothetical protein
MKHEKNSTCSTCIFTPRVKMIKGGELVRQYNISQNRLQHIDPSTEIF